jgi:membrane-associated phospholipid phosphatase
VDAGCPSVGGVIELRSRPGDRTTSGPDADRERLLPRELRAAAALLGVGCFVVFVFLAVRVAGTTAATPFDAWVEGVLTAHHRLSGSWTRWAVAAGEPVTVISGAAVLAGWCLHTRRIRPAIVSVLLPGLTGVAETVLKPVVGRTIPDGELAFPSGHTAGVTALGLAVAVVVGAVVRERRAACLAVLAAATVAAAGGVALGLIAEHAHYPTDTIGGLCMAIVIAVVTVLAVDGLPGMRTTGVVDD